MYRVATEAVKAVKALKAVKRVFVMSPSCKMCEKDIILKESEFSHSTCI